MGCGGSSITAEDIKSDIILRENDKEYLIEILSQTLKTSKFTMSLLYNGKKNGFESSTFHNCCDGKGKTVIICETQSGNIFGGYTSIPWSMDNQYHADTHAFLFIIKNQNGDRKLVPLKVSTEATKHAVQHIASKGPTFGKAIHSLSICDKPHIASNSYTNENSSYEFDGNELCGGKEESDGEYYFKMKNYEVYQVV
eukprot:380267_1